jgi:hypothetical protein
VVIKSSLVGDSNPKLVSLQNDDTIVVGPILLPGEMNNKSIREGNSNLMFPFV